MADQDLIRPQRSGAAAFALSDEQREILEQADNYARNELLPLQQRMDNEEWWPPHVMPALGRMGYLGVTVAPEFGGSGGDFFTTGPHHAGLRPLEPGDLALLRGAREPVPQQHLPQRQR